ncbi:MAG: hypothetical protein QM753_15045 [Thermomicrobiales bacterium]
MTDRDSLATSPATSPARIPAPDGGLGSHELETDSDDPAVLRQALHRAKERLAFYESFDRIIGENIKRSGELMLETIALREEAQAAEQARTAREAEIERERQAERAQTTALLASLRDEIAGFQTTTQALAGRVADALRVVAPDEAAPIVTAETPAAATTSPDESDAPATPAAPEDAPRTAFRPFRHNAAPAVPLPTEPDDAADEDASPASSEPEPERKTIDLVVNGIARATTALAFQRTLNGRDGILNVETREFAEGVLRLKVDVATDDTLSDEAFAAWTGPGTVQVLTRQPTLIALELTEA